MVSSKPPGIKKGLQFSPDIELAQLDIVPEVERHASQTGHWLSVEFDLPKPPRMLKTQGRDLQSLHLAAEAHQ